MCTMKVIKYHHINLKFDVLSYALCDGFTVGSCFVTVRFMTIYFCDPCQIGPSTPDLWCITVATRASFLFLVRFLLFSVVCFFFFYFSTVLLSWLWFFPPMMYIKKTEKKKKSKQLMLHSFLMSSEPQPGPS